ncbi:hypothetical protein NKG94_08005 [Micromonospora sp. M12]
MDDQSPLSADELLDIVDEHDQVVRQARRVRRTPIGCGIAVCSFWPGTPLAASSCTAGRRRSSSFRRCTTCSSAGWLARANPMTRRLREAEEELGCPATRARAAVHVPLRDPGARLVVLRLRGALPDPVAPQAEEIAWHDFVTEEELRQRLTEWAWVPDGLEAYRRLLTWRATD